MNEIDTCPFCGGEARVTTAHISYGHEIGEVFCTRCYARITTKEFPTEEEAKNEAIRLWNNRVVDTRSLSSLAHEMYDEYYGITLGCTPPTPMLKNFAVGKVSTTILESIGEEVYPTSCPNCGKAIADKSEWSEHEQVCLWSNR